MGLITRFYGPNAKGSKLTIKEMDNNLYYLQNNGVVGVDFLSGNLILTNPTGATLTTKIDRYNKNYIPSGETFTVPNGYQNFVYGDVIIEGTLNIEENGELVVLNGDIIISGGTIVGSGTTYSVTLPEFNTFVTSGNYNSTSKQITFNGNFGFTPFNVDLSGITVGGGLEGTNYIYVAANGTPIENATELQVAYDEAKTMSPSQPNRITIICGPGKYEFPNYSPFTLDTAFIDLVSLTGNRDVFLYTTNSNTNLTTTYNIDITTDNIFVKGIDTSTSVWVNLKGGVLSSGSFRISNSLSNLTCENCKGGSVSFGGGGDTSGTFTNCVGGNVSFGGNGTASGTFTNCVGGDGSFGGNGTASGTFTNCVGGVGSFGLIASGTFTNCVSDGSSFGNGTLSGKLFYCRLTTGTFNVVSGSGKTLYCIDGNNDPNNQGFTPQNII